MATAEELCTRYPDVLYPGDLRDVPQGWFGIVDKYLEVVALLMKDTGYEVVSASERAGGLDWMWTSPLSTITEELHRVVEGQSILLELRSYHTCRICGRPGFGWATGRSIITACEQHGVGDRIVNGRPLRRRTPHGVVLYDVVADQLADVDAENI